MNKKILINLLGALVLSVVLLWVLFNQVPLNDVLASLNRISFLVLATTFGLYVISNIFRALRFRLITNNSYSLRYFFDVASVLNMMNVLLPSRTGELSYIYLLKKSGSKVAESIASLVLARIFDFIALSSIFLFSVLFISREPLIQNIMWIVAIFMLALALILIIFIIYEQKFISLAKIIFHKLNLDKFNITKALFKKSGELLSSLKIIKSRKAVIHIMAYTYFIWLCYYLISYLVLSSVGFNSPVLVFTVGLTLSVLSSIIPISGIAGFGTYEAYWTIIFLSLGIQKEMAITFGFVNHIINLLYVVIIGLISFFILNKEYHYFSKSG